MPAVLQSWMAACTSGLGGSIIPTKPRKTKLSINDAGDVSVLRYAIAIIR